MRTATRSMVEGHAPATVTGAAGKLRQACARRWRLPKAVSGHGRRQGVAGVAMECYGGDGVARRELVHGYGDGGAGQWRYADGGYGGSNERYAEHH